MRFVLVHGGAHGAWCWDKTVTVLRKLGHETCAVDLPGHGKRQGEKSTLHGYRDAVLDELRPGDILVGHSMGGHVITAAADVATVKLRHLVYLSGGVPAQGKSIIDLTPLDEIGLSENYQLMEGPHGLQFQMTSLESATKYFFHDCTEADARWAGDNLSPQQMLPLTTPIVLERFWRLSIPRSYILCTDDRTQISRYLAGFLERLKLYQVYPIWSSHSPFISRPVETAKLLVTIGSAGEI